MYPLSEPKVQPNLLMKNCTHKKFITTFFSCIFVQNNISVEGYAKDYKSKLKWEKYGKVHWGLNKYERNMWKCLKLAKICKSLETN